MGCEQKIAPDHTAVRVALWRALHVQIDLNPHVFTDEVGMKLVEEQDWRSRTDMEPSFSKPMRASIVGRSRYVEDLLETMINRGVEQYVILGAGLDTFAQRRPEIASRMQIFEIDQVGPQAWKKQKLRQLGYVLPEWLHFVPVNFEAGQSWWELLLSSDFDAKKPAIVVSTGVSMYLTKQANMEIFDKISKLSRGSMFVTTFMLTLHLLEPSERSVMEFVMKRAEESKTPFLSLFSPDDIMKLAKEAGFSQVQYVSAEDIYQRYFAKRSDGLRAGSAEAFLVAEV